MTLDELAPRLRARRVGPDRWKGHCPGSAHKHGDRDPSLSIRRWPGGRHTLKCFAFDCQPREIADALGISFAELLHDMPASRSSRQRRPQASEPLIIAEALAQPWRAHLAEYREADELRRAFGVVRRARRWATSRGPRRPSWDVLALAARLEIEVEALDAELCS